MSTALVVLYRACAVPGRLLLALLLAVCCALQCEANGLDDGRQAVYNSQLVAQGSPGEMVPDDAVERAQENWREGWKNIAAYHLYQGIDENKKPFEEKKPCCSAYAMDSSQKFWLVMWIAEPWNNQDDRWRVELINRKAVNDSEKIKEYLKLAPGHECKGEKCTSSVTLGATLRFQFVDRNGATRKPEISALVRGSSALGKLGASCTEKERERRGWMLGEINRVGIKDTGGFWKRKYGEDGEWESALEYLVCGDQVLRHGSMIHGRELYTMLEEAKSLPAENETLEVTFMVESPLKYYSFDASRGETKRAAAGGMRKEWEAFPPALTFSMKGLVEALQVVSHPSRWEEVPGFK